MASVPAANTHRLLLWLLAIGVGSLTSITLFHLFPEAWARLGLVEALGLMLLGYLILYLISWLVHRSCRHRHHSHSISCDHSDPLAGIAVNMTASCAHSLQDGLMLGVSFLHGAPYGFVALYSTLLHEIPKKLGDYSFIRPRTTLLNTLLLLGITVIATLGSAAVIYALAIEVDEMPWLTALLAGGFAYYVWGHMLPDLLGRMAVQQVRRLTVVLAVGVGLIGMSLLMNLLEHGHIG